VPAIFGNCDGSHETKVAAAAVRRPRDRVVVSQQPNVPTEPQPSHRSVSGKTVTLAVTLAGYIGVNINRCICWKNFAM